MHFRDGEPMPCDADEADDSLVACLHRGVQRSAFPQRELPLDHVHQVVQLEQIDPIDAETIERSANLLARPRVVALMVLRYRDRRNRTHEAPVRVRLAPSLNHALLNLAPLTKRMTG